MTQATEFEEKILAICRRLLQKQDFGETDNFFDAGGHSLLAMTLVLEIERQTNCKVDLEQLARAATVRDLCASLRPRKREKSTLQVGPAVVIPVKTGSSDSTLYVVHSAFDFSSLSDALSAELSIAFVMINDSTWLRKAVDHEDSLVTIEMISFACAQAIAARNGEGRCYLAGHSFGGIVAVETAARLEDLSYRPCGVFLFDTYLHKAIHRIIFDILNNGLLRRKLRRCSG